MVRFLENNYFNLFLRFAVGFVFIYAGVEKIADPEGFAVSIENYRVLPVALVNLAAISLPWIELVSGLMLIAGISIKENIAIINSLLFIFILLVIFALLRGLDIDCGCFGTSDGQKVGIAKILENLALFAAGVLVFKFDNNPLKLR